MNKVLPSCREVSHLASREMDESLAFRQRLALRLHLIMCVWCRRSTGQLRLMRNLARHQPVSTGDPSRLSADARRRIDGRLSADARRRIDEALDQSDEQL